MSLRKVAVKLRLKKSTVEDIIRKAKTRAVDSEDFDDVLDCLESFHRGGYPEKYPKGQHNIFRYEPAHKPSLIAKHMKAHLAFAHITLQIAVNTIVFTDEMRQQNVSRYRGVDANKYTIHDKDSEKQPIWVMFWGTIIPSTKGPYHIWEPDTE
ncbi:hypothetical protein HOY82DRAFT_538892 [Tuber indicum]|nr:hypothetical protein HOY82DRAFT_538892 [Tuber indicum]